MILAGMIGMIHAGMIGMIHAGMIGMIHVPTTVDDVILAAVNVG